MEDEEMQKAKELIEKQPLVAAQLMMLAEKIYRILESAGKGRSEKK